MAIKSNARTHNAKSHTEDRKCDTDHYRINGQNSNIDYKVF